MILIMLNFSNNSELQQEFPNYTRVPMSTDRVTLKTWAISIKVLKHYYSYDNYQVKKKPFLLSSSGLWSSELSTLFHS